MYIIILLLFAMIIIELSARPERPGRPKASATHTNRRRASAARAGLPERAQDQPEPRKEGRHPATDPSQRHRAQLDTRTRHAHGRNARRHDQRHRTQDATTPDGHRTASGKNGKLSTAQPRRSYPRTRPQDQHAAPPLPPGQRISATAKSPKKPRRSPRSAPIPSPFSRFFSIFPIFLDFFSIFHPPRLPPSRFFLHSARLFADFFSI